jgi:hypothetical protein
LNSSQKADRLPDLAGWISSFHEGHSDFLFGRLSAGREKGASAHDAGQQSDLLQEFPSRDHVFLLNA